MFTFLLIQVGIENLDQLIDVVENLFKSLCSADLSKIEEGIKGGQLSENFPTTDPLFVAIKPIKDIMDIIDPHKLLDKVVDTAVCPKLQE